MANKKFIKLKNFLAHVKSRVFMPYSLFSEFFPRKSYSCFFILNTSFYKTKFIAENLYSILLNKKVEVCHRFKFFDSLGKSITIFDHVSSDNISKIDLPIINSKDLFVSFVHEVIPINFNLNSYDIDFKKISLQHRGYTIYKKEKNSLGSIVHGNFGAISSIDKLSFGAKVRSKKFIYTPAYVFSYSDCYDLVFNNPTSKVLDIKLKFNSHTDVLSIPSLGTYSYQVINYQGLISFISKLPICRCLVFKNSKITDYNFDVFHS